ncbi:hypothetical protein NMG60_11026426 [Bertholletia excelsa]
MQLGSSLHLLSFSCNEMLLTCWSIKFRQWRELECQPSRRIKFQMTCWLSCEEDYALCAPFLEKEVAVYNSELLLNGIITQKLEHHPFINHIEKTRSTLWLKQNDN